MITQDEYGNIELDNRERNVVLLSQRQSFGSFNILFVQREKIDELIETLNRYKQTKKVKQFKRKVNESIK